MGVEGSDLITVSQSDACRTTSFDRGAEDITDFPGIDVIVGVVAILTRVGVALVRTAVEGIGDWVLTGVPGRVFGVTITYFGAVVVGTGVAVTDVRGTVRIVEVLVTAGITRGC